MTPSGVAPPPRIAVACSGLGHIQRGIESWADDLGRALRRAGADVTLFAGAEAAGATALACLRRTDPAAIRLARFVRHLGGWRYGMGNTYEIEQSSFAFALWRRIRRDFDVLHVQDPTLARWLEQAHRRGLSRPRVVYANGTGEPAAATRRFAFLQLLTPQALQEWEREKPPDQSVFMIPNFIDTARFAPGDAAAARAALGLPPRALIVLCCAAIRRYHKRIDYLLTEFAAVAAEAGRELLLVIAGGRETDTDALIAMGQQLLGERVRFLVGLPRAAMPTLYQAADLFVLASLWEMFGIVLIEAMASGLPLICHDTPAFRFVAGPAALYADLQPAGGLAGALRGALADDRRAALAQAARPHVQSRFAEAVVVSQIIAMYQAVLAVPDRGNP
jgi:1,2-diacylglycerol 3-alpha-glucosyltransferase